MRVKRKDCAYPVLIVDGKLLGPDSLLIWPVVQSPSTRSNGERAGH
ncbi:hypothetical protein AtDm6_1450 [Acetobacter tropicalis]|uniref:Uncharacterized protein n=1 Tax=Acetobacter tropicalis TaxID=104102 RepID=A0A094YTT6_9PROT|nr:hypothetical protein AtDm6_1450 [Acetobacter tropicalis]